MKGFSNNTVRAFERALSIENANSVPSKQYYDDFVRSLSSLLKKHVIHARVEHLPGMQGDDAMVVKAWFSNAKLSTPYGVNGCGDVKNCLTPTEARLLDLTLASAIYVDMHVETQEPSSSSGVVYKGSSCTKVFLGTMPVMVGSQSCTTQITGDTSQEIDAGGYFIIKGNEKIIPWFRLISKYGMFCYMGNEGEMYFTVRSGSTFGKIRSTRLKKPTDSPATMKFSKSSQFGGDLTPGHVLALLGVSDPKEKVFDHMMGVDASYYGEGSFEVPDDAVQEVMDDIPGCLPSTPKSKKACAVVSMLRIARQMRETNNFTDRDSLQSQQLEGVKEILTEVFDKNMRATVKVMRHRLETRLRKLHNQRNDNKRHRAATLQMPNANWVSEQLAKHSSIGPGIHYFFATGNLQGGGGASSGGGGRPHSRTRAGCCQILERTSELQRQSGINKVVTPLEAQSAPTVAREYRLDMLGYLCPVATPEGKRTGLINQRAIGSSVSRDRFDRVQAIQDMVAHFTETSPKHYGAQAAGVWMSGVFLGCTHRPKELVLALRSARRDGQLPRDIGVSLYGENVGVEIRVHSGRMLKPLLPLDRKVTKTQLQRALNTTWSHLIHSGIVETLDTREEGGMYVCAAQADATSRHTHREMFPTASLGCCAATIPYLDHEPSPRASYFTSQAQQAMGFDMRNFSNRMDTKSFQLWYPQKSIVKTSYELSSQSEMQAPVGVNVVVAIMSLQGAEEDAILVNKSFVERGGFRGTQWDTKTVSTADKVLKCFAVSDAQKENSTLHAIDPNTGIARLGSRLSTGDAYACLASESGVQSIKHDNALDSVVQKVLVFDNLEGHRTAKIKLRTDRVLEVGDKLSSRYAQKGVVSRLLNAADMPWLEDGGMIDILINPCMLPSRMTVGSLMESTAAFAAAEIGMSHVDATAFAHSTASLVEDLRNKGFRTNARWVRDPYTGERYPERIEIGIAKYNRLNKFSSDKAKARRTGLVDEITGQPIGKGAQRFGVMETSAIASHGGSATLDDACRVRSDGTTFLVCRSCGNAHSKGKQTPCTLCGAGAVEVQSTKAAVRMTQVCEAMGVGLNFKVDA